jgi:hypothetical protein
LPSDDFPAGTFTDVSAGCDSCGVDSTGAIQCWGERETAAPANPTRLIAVMMGSDLGHPVMMAPMMYGMFGTMIGGMLGAWLARLFDEHEGHPDHDNPVVVSAMALMAGMMGGMPSTHLGFPTPAPRRREPSRHSPVRCRETRCLASGLPFRRDEFRWEPA